MKDFLNSMIELNHTAHVNPPSKVILVAKKSKCFGELESLFNRISGRTKGVTYSKMISLNNEQNCKLLMRSTKHIMLQYSVM